MFCPKCGNSIEDGNAFCNQCGTAVRAGRPPATQGPAVANAAQAEGRPPFPVAGEQPGKSRILPFAIGGILVAVLAIVVAVLVFGGASGNQQAPAGSVQTQGVTLADIVTLGESELVGKLQASGFTYTAKGSYDNYSDGTLSVDIYPDMGFRTTDLPSGSDSYQLLQDEGLQFKAIGTYSGDGQPITVGVCTVSGSDGLVIAGAGVMAVVEPGHMGEISRIYNNVDFSDSMDTDEAAARLVQSLEEQGRFLSEGDGIDTSVLGDTDEGDSESEGDDEGASEASEPVDVNSIYGEYEDRRDGPSDYYGYFSAFRIYEDPYNGGSWVKLSWHPAKYTLNGDEIKLMYSSVELVAQLDVYEQGGTTYFQTIESKSTGTEFNASGEFSNGELKITGGTWRVTQSDQSQIELDSSEVTLYKK